MNLILFWHFVKFIYLLLCLILSHISFHPMCVVMEYLVKVNWIRRHREWFQKSSAFNVIKVKLPKPNHVITYLRGAQEKSLFIWLDCWFNQILEYVSYDKYFFNHINVTVNFFSGQVYFWYILYLYYRLMWCVKRHVL